MGKAVRKAFTRNFRRKSTRGFTLVELLVVIGIIAVLMGILLPALAGASESARSVQCLSNLRQMVTAAHAYANDHAGRYPISRFNASRPGEATVAHAWDFTATTAGGVTAVTPGLLWQGAGDAKVQQCPSFDGKANSAGDPYTGYNYNTSYVGHGQGEAVVAPAKVTDVRDPAGTALFGDGEFGGGANKYMRAPFENPGDATFSGRFAGTQGFRHRGRTNVGFCDGHAESLGERFTDTYPDDRAQVAPGTGFLSRDNSLYDLK